MDNQWVLIEMVSLKEITCMVTVNWGMSELNVFKDSFRHGDSKYRLGSKDLWHILHSYLLWIIYGLLAEMVSLSSWGTSGICDPMSWWSQCGDPEFYKCNAFMVHYGRLWFITLQRLCDPEVHSSQTYCTKRTILLD